MNLDYLLRFRKLYIEKNSLLFDNLYIYDRLYIYQINRNRERQVYLQFTCVCECVYILISKKRIVLYCYVIRFFFLKLFYSYFFILK